MRGRQARLPPTLGLAQGELIGRRLAKCQWLLTSSLVQLVVNEFIAMRPQPVGEELSGSLLGEAVGQLSFAAHPSDLGPRLEKAVLCDHHLNRRAFFGPKTHLQLVLDQEIIQGFGIKHECRRMREPCGV